MTSSVTPLTPAQYLAKLNEIDSSLSSLVDEYQGYLKVLNGSSERLDQSESGQGQTQATVASLKAAKELMHRELRCLQAILELVRTLKAKP